MFLVLSILFFFVFFFFFLFSFFPLFSFHPLSSGSVTKLNLLKSLTYLNYDCRLQQYSTSTIQHRVGAVRADFFSPTSPFSVVHSLSYFPSALRPSLSLSIYILLHFSFPVLSFFFPPLLVASSFTTFFLSSSLPLSFLVTSILFSSSLPLFFYSSLPFPFFVASFYHSS